MKMRMKTSNVDPGLLLLRVGFGLTMFFFHGWQKLSGGPELWSQIGGVMSAFGISFAPTAFGFAAAFAESIGSILLIVGLLTRPAAMLLAATMVVASYFHLAIATEAQGSGWKAASSALEYLCVYLVLLLTGPGRYSLDAILRPGKRRFFRT